MRQTLLGIPALISLLGALAGPHSAVLLGAQEYSRITVDSSAPGAHMPLAETKQYFNAALQQYGRSNPYSSDPRRWFLAPDSMIRRLHREEEGQPAFASFFSGNECTWWIFEYSPAGTLNPEGYIIYKLPLDMMTAPILHRTSSGATLYLRQREGREMQSLNDRFVPVLEYDDEVPVYMTSVAGAERTGRPLARAIGICASRASPDPFAPTRSNRESRRPQ